MSNFDAFMRDTKKAIEVERAKQVSEARKIVITAYGAITTGSTAVNYGLYKASHLIGVNSNDTTVPERRTTKMSDGEIDSKNSKEQSKISSLKFNNGDVISIYNNTDYADYIESGVYTNREPKSQQPALYGRVIEKIRTLLNKKVTL